MRTHIFDGKYEAQEIYSRLKEDISKLRKDGIRPTLASLIVGDSRSAIKYASLKKSAAQGIGADVNIRNFEKTAEVDEIISFIQELNVDKNYHGLMLQTPLPDRYGEKVLDQVVSAIADEKDVDGMKEGSSYIAPTVKAVLIALKKAHKYTDVKGEVNIVVGGSRGFIGSKILKALDEMQYSVMGFDDEVENVGDKTKNADVVISAIGKQGIIKKEDIREGAVLIDVGEPKADFDDEAKEKASFVTPVPGGIGPLTIACLLENLTESAKTFIEK